MSYASRGEKIFDLQNPQFLECTPPKIKRSDHRLKSFFSTSDRRAWDFCDIIRYRHFYECVSGSETCLIASSTCHKYVPLEDLIAILMADKDARIEELERMLRRCQKELEAAVRESRNVEEFVAASPDEDAAPIDVAEDFSDVAEEVSDVAEEVSDVAEEVSDVAEVVSDVANVSDVPDVANVSDVASAFSDALTVSIAPVTSDTRTVSIAPIPSDARTVSVPSDARTASVAPVTSAAEPSRSMEAAGSIVATRASVNSGGVNQVGCKEMEASREMLRKAMHKLQNIDEIVNENKRLQCRLRCSEERVKFLEQRKQRLESELSDLRSKSRIQFDLEKAQEMLAQVNQREGTESAGAERDQLEEKIKQLERELMESKKKEGEIEMLKKQSKSNILSLEELSRENECYRKKLSSMKCLEKQIQDIKKQGLALADKYKRESQKAAEQMKKMCSATKELQALRAERDSLQKRVDELSSHEGQYKALQCKLKRVDAVIAENEMLNSKLMALDQLEKENEYLKCRLDQIQEIEMNAIEDKERIAELQSAVAEQEEEMKDMLCHIERLTNGQTEEELERLKCELYETNSKLKLCEEQLAEIPMLEAEVDELRKKLQCCCKDFAEQKTSEHQSQKLEVRLPSKSRSISVKYKTENQKMSSVMGVRKEEKISFDENKTASCQEIITKEETILTSFSTADADRQKEAMSCEEVQSLLQSSKGIISCVLEDMIEHHKEMEELEECNRAMKNEIEMLKAKIGGCPDTDKLLSEINALKEAIEEKDREIVRLSEASAVSAKPSDEWDLETLKELNQQMKDELEATCVELKNLKNIEKVLEMERKARCQAERMLRQKDSSQKQPGSLHEEDPEFDCCRGLQKETNDLKLQILELNKLTNELKKENELLRELQQPCPDFSKELDEKCALENLLTLLQAELDTFKGQKMSDECVALRNELKRVLEQNCQLKALVDCYRERLRLEKPAEPREPTPRVSEEEEEEPQSLTVYTSGKKFDVSEEEIIRATVAKEEEAKSPEVKEEEVAAEEEEGKIPSVESIRLSEGAAEEASSDESKAPVSPHSKGASTSEETMEGSTAKEEPEAKLEEIRSEEVRLASSGEEFEGVIVGVEETVRETSDDEKVPSSRTSKIKSTSEPEETPKLSDEEGSMAKVESPLEVTADEMISEKERPSIQEIKEKSVSEGLPEKSSDDKRSLFEEEKEEEPSREPEEPSPEPEEEMPRMSEEKIVSKEETFEVEVEKKKEKVEEKVVEEETAIESEKILSVVPSRGHGETIVDELIDRVGTQGDENYIRNLLDEIERLKKLVEEKDRALKDLREMLNERENELKALRAESPASVTAIVPRRGETLENLLRQMEEENAEKIKKLMEQHQKELENQEKAFNENMNSMKSGYEADIKKLAEKQKVSVIRLQELHDDEVKEMRRDFETEMEVMQTQSEKAMNNIARESAANLRKLSQQHDREMKTAREKVKKLEDGLSKSMQELQQLRKQAGDGGESKMTEMKAQHTLEMQKMKKSSLRKMSSMASKYEGMLADEKRKSEARIESLKRNLKERLNEGVCDCKFAKRKAAKYKDPTCPLDFEEILEKILEQGLECLSFNEIALVHGKACCALKQKVLNSNVRSVLEPPVGQECPDVPLLQADKDQLMQRIFALENEIVLKQKQTQEAILNMEVTIKKERCRLQDLKSVLQNEQQKNSELKLLLSSQTKLQSDLREERDRLGNQASLHQTLCLEKTKQLNQEIEDKKYLESEVDRLRMTVQQLFKALEAERQNAKSIHGKECNFIQSMKTKLEQSFNQERSLALRLENEIKCRMELQCQLQNLKQSFQRMVNLPAVDDSISPSPVESKSAKEKKNLDQIKEKKAIKTKTVSGKKHRK